MKQRERQRSLPATDISLDELNKTTKMSQDNRPWGTDMNPGKGKFHPTTLHEGPERK